MTATIVMAGLSFMAGLNLQQAVVEKYPVAWINAAVSLILLVAYAWS